MAVFALPISRIRFRSKSSCTILEMVALVSCSCLAKSAREMGGIVYNIFQHQPSVGVPYHFLIDNGHNDASSYKILSAFIIHGSADRGKDNLFKG